jgi:hypothetical protein
MMAHLAWRVDARRASHRQATEESGPHRRIDGRPAQGRQDQAGSTWDEDDPHTVKEMKKALATPPAAIFLFDRHDQFMTD